MIILEHLFLKFQAMFKYKISYFEAMEDISIVEYKEVDLSNSMLVVAFPTVGLVSSFINLFLLLL